MRKIDYSGLEKEYLKELGLYDGYKYTEDYFNLEKEWIKNRNGFSLNFLPRKLKKILISNYVKLIKYQIAFKPLKQEDNDVLLQKVFMYDKMKEKIAKFFIHKAKQLNLYSCCYCDSAFEGDFVDKNGERRTFDVDHFIPKAKYPVFALSLYNFIPSCQVCNERIKGEKLFFQIDTIKRYDKKRKLLIHLSPTSKDFNFNDNVKISYIPKKQKDIWHYAPLSQVSSERYSVFFDTDKDSSYKRFIDVMLLQERYNSTAIKNQGLYLLDLKKKYPLSKLVQMSKMLTDGGYPVSPEEIENDIFHKNQKYKLLEKMRNDLLE